MVDTDQRKVWHREYDRKRAMARKAKIIREYGGVCELCEERDKDLLKISHIGEFFSLVDYTDHLKLMKHIEWYVEKHNFPKYVRFRLLCQNCRQLNKEGKITYNEGRINLTNDPE